MDIAVRPVLRAHVVEVIARGQLAPVLEDVRVARLVALLHGALEVVEVLRGAVLDRVAEPRGEIALAVGPRDPLRHVVLADRLVAVEDLRRREEVVVPAVVVVDRARQRVEELEDPRVGPLVLAEGLVVHEQVAAEAVAVDLVDPARELLGGKRPFLPAPVREAEGDVVAQAVVLEEQLDRAVGEVAFARRRVDIVRRAEAEQAVDALADDRAVLAALRHVRGELVRVDELGVAEDLRRHAEDLLHALLVEVDLRVELRAGEEERERVVARLADEFARARVDEALQRVDDIGRPQLELRERRARDRVRAAEALVMPLHEVEHHRRRGAIALVRDLAHDPLVRLVVEVERIGREDRVAPQPVGLVELEVEADACHGGSVADNRQVP